MNKKLAKTLIDVCEGRREADLLITNCQVVDVFNKCTFPAAVSVVDGHFASFSADVKARRTIDAQGRYLIPGFIDAHCHIESSHVSPAAFSDLIVPKGTTTVVADPHEICNVAGLDAMRYMLDASADLPLSVYLMFPSCVPATDSENAGAVLLADSIAKMIDEPRILGLGEMMNYPGIAAGLPFVLDKLECAYSTGKLIDGHAPDVKDRDLDAYSACRIISDHECATPQELVDRVRRGMYVALREGTACRNVLALLPGVDEDNMNRVMFCTDDCQPESIIDKGHIQNAVNLAIGAGMRPERAIAAATINAATCYGLKDRGAVAPGLRADFFLADDLSSIRADEVYVEGRLVASHGAILEKARHVEPVGVSGMMDVKDFSISHLALPLRSDRARVIGINPGSVVTDNLVMDVKRDEDGLFVRDEDLDVLKIASVERHKGTGNVGVGLIAGYGMRNGAVATSISHDSHNIIVVGTSDEDMAAAVDELVSTGGGITIVQDGKVLMTHRLEIAGLMTDDDAMSVYDVLKQMHEIAYDRLGVNRDIDPFMTLSFMALPVIPALKITDTGLFDVSAFAFTGIDP